MIKIVNKNCLYCQKNFLSLASQKHRYCCGSCGAKNRKVSSITKEKLRKSQLGIPHSLETKEKIKNNRWGKNYIAKPRKPSLGLWIRSFDPLVQLEKKRFRNQRYKANKKHAEGSHTFEEWLLLKSYYQNMCLCCKKQEPEIQLSEDHIFPLSKGGGDNIENIQPLCISCNTKKRIDFIDYRNYQLIKTEGGEIYN